MSRNAKIFSDSNNLKEGMSPVEFCPRWIVVSLSHFIALQDHVETGGRGKSSGTFDDLAEDTSRHLYGCVYVNRVGRMEDTMRAATSYDVEVFRSCFQCEREEL